MKYKPKILYLTYDGLTDPLGESQIIPYLLGLSQGFDITVVSFEKPDAYKRKQAIIEAQVKGKIHWISAFYTKNPPVLSTIYDLFTLRRICKKIMASKEVKVVHCRSYITSIVGLWLKKKFNIRFIFDMRGFWADERVEGGLWNRHNILFELIYKYVKKKEIEFITNADHVIVLTQKAKNIINSFGRREAITVIPCCVDTYLFNPDHLSESRQRNLRNKLGLVNQDFVLTYIGSIGTWYRLGEMFCFFNELCLQHGKSKFLILTGDSEDAIVKEAVSKMVNLNNIIIKRVNRDEMPLYISISDFTILFIAETYSKQGSSPTKLGESLAMGVPAIANANVGDNLRLFQDETIGVVIGKLEDFHYKEGVKKILAFKKDQNAIRKFAEHNLSLIFGIDLYNKVYRNVLSDSYRSETRSI